MQLTSESGAKILLSDEYRSGGRGKVHDVVGNQSMVCKVFGTRYRTDARRGKVTREIEMKDEVEGVVAWPLESVFDKDRNWVGYLMPKVEGERLDVYLRTENTSLSFRIKAAQMVCSCVCKMHSRNVIVGDLSWANFIYSPKDGKLRLIDPDSFQIVDDRKKKIYAVTESRNKSPEMLEHGNGPRAISSASDDFLLAVTLFEVIFLRNPFDEYESDADPVGKRTENILNRRFPYAETKDVPPLNITGDRLPGLFVRSFTTEGKPPTSREYKEALDELAAQGIVVCRSCDCEHASSGACPCCGRSLQQGQRARQIATKLSGISSIASRTCLKIATTIAMVTFGFLIPVVAPALGAAACTIEAYQQCIAGQPWIEQAMTSVVLLSTLSLLGVRQIDIRLRKATCSMIMLSLLVFAPAMRDAFAALPDVFVLIYDAMSGMEWL